MFTYEELQFSSCTNYGVSVPRFGGFPICACTQEEKEHMGFVDPVPNMVHVLWLEF
jgi:hypothetical protein